MTRIRFSVAALAALLAACGGSDTPTDPTPTVAQVTVSPTSATLTQGATQQFQATAKDADGNVVSGQTVTWNSSAAAVATVSSAGLATAVAAGSANITATVGGVTGSAALTVSAPAACSSPETVSLSVGEWTTYDGSTCLLLPSGSVGDRYRVVVLRPGTTGSSADVATATLSVVGEGVSQQASAPAPLVAAATDASFVADIPGFSARDARQAIRIAEATERFHATLRRQEEVLLRTVGLKNLSWAREHETALQPMAAAAPALAPSPEKITLDTTTGTTCETTPAAKKTALRIYETDNLVFYQDSTQNATDPVKVEHVQEMAAYYDDYSKSMIESYFGAPSDIDGNGKIIVYVSPNAADNVAAYVWSGDFFDNDPANPNGCEASNEAEIIYFNLSVIQGMDSGRYQALETLAHEMKHVVSLHHRISASLQAGVSRYHPTWVEEGTAEIAGEMSSRIAWAAIGGPAVGARVSRNSFANTNGNIVPENYGVAIKLARTAWYLSDQPNGLVITPDGAPDGASVYGSGWLFHRWLGDAYGGAGSSAQQDASLFYTLSDSMSLPGTDGIQVATGKSFLTLLDEFAGTLALHQAVGGTVPRDFTTYDLVTAAEIFCTPNPLGVFPWPVTTSGTAGNCDNNITEASSPTKSFATATYAGPIGPTGMRIHDFLSNGTGSGARIQLTLASPAKLLVARLR